MELNNVTTSNTAFGTYKAKHSSNVITWADVSNATAADPNVQAILQLLVTGFPEDSRRLPAPIRPYHPVSSSLYELEGVLMMSERIVVPTSLRPAILDLLHADYQGIDRMKAQASEHGVLARHGGGHLQGQMGVHGLSQDGQIKLMRHRHSSRDGLSTIGCHP